MRMSYQRICALLAAADIDEREIWEFATAVSEVGPPEVARRVRDIRNMLMGDMRSYETDSQVRKSASNPGLPSETAEKIAQLLLFEAGLSKLSAITLLTQKLQTLYPSKSIPQESRKGFTNWIQKLSTIVSEAELLHLATRVRNEFVHDRPADWHLR